MHYTENQNSIAQFVVCNENTSEILFKECCFVLTVNRMKLKYFCLKSKLQEQTPKINATFVSVIIPRIIM